MVKKAYGKGDRVNRKILRESLAYEQKWLCYYCRSPMGSNVTIEHVKTLSSGGRDTRTNMKAACKFCNNTRGCMPHGQFWKLIKKRDNPPDDMDLWIIWMRRRLSLRTERAVKRISRFVGMEAT